jgi:uncharacterized protein YecT (DUF1311 family)
LRPIIIPVAVQFLRASLFLSLFLFAISSAVAAEAETEPETKTEALDKKIEAMFENATSRSGEQAAYDEGRILWEKEMNRVYGELLQGLSKEAAARLKKSQRNWLTYRTQQIAYLDEFYKGFSGTMYNTFHSYAVMDVTRQRTLSLARQLKYVEDGEYGND